ncbi:MraY family glycosyltransferase [Flavobacterium succinicans]|uniref:Putative undecaprenyl-phosphate N-acetylglucosaminyl 1-phosphate transferase n=1 Tax=Flavobacterium succinicans TaxID=29536 RepID=A0A199XRY0_9FLAO|nr:MraY family glycosyltransferase [Flavobacterium succinicans]OAZ04011.1 putative undecaprenyl-phosphate N-acetylglucosaminyl 1-phosphate transferase [Flavobacterium succinicans]
MKTIIVLLSYALLSLLITLLITPILKKTAIRINLVDQPNHRKVHQTAIPLVGGIAVFFSSFIVILAAAHQNSFRPYLTIFSASFILLIVGIIDDKRDLNAKLKLAIQLLLALLICLDGTRITSLYGLFGIYSISSWVQYLLTIVVITGVVNAFNLMDGVDGLVGSLSMIGFLSLFFTSLYFGTYNLSLLSIIFMGSTIGFLYHNLSRSKIFMGDSGSLSLGFLLVTFGIHFLQHETLNPKWNPLYPFLLLLAFFSIPVFDSLRVYMGRIKKGNSPFKADKSHLHHLLLGSGLTHKKTTLSIALFCLFFLGLGFGLVNYFSTTIILFFTLLAFWLIIRFLLMINKLQKWKSILKKLEKEQ